MISDVTEISGRDKFPILLIYNNQYSKKRSQILSNKYRILLFTVARYWNKTGNKLELLSLIYRNRLEANKERVCML